MLEEHNQAAKVRQFQEKYIFLKFEEFKYLCCGSSLHLDQVSSQDNRSTWQWSYAVRISDCISGEQSSSPLSRMFGCQSQDGVRWDMNTPPLCWGSLHTGDCSPHYLANISLEQTKNSMSEDKNRIDLKAGDMKPCLQAYEIQGVNWNKKKPQMNKDQQFALNVCTRLEAYRSLPQKFWCVFLD